MHRTTSSDKFDKTHRLTRHKKKLWLNGIKKVGIKKIQFYIDTINNMSSTDANESCCPHLTLGSCDHCVALDALNHGRVSASASCAGVGKYDTQSKDALFKLGHARANEHTQF